MDALQIVEIGEGREKLFIIQSANGHGLAERKSLRAAENYVAKWTREKDKYRGKTIHVQRALRDDFDPCFFIEPGGRGIDREKVARLLDHGVIRPVGDALFPGMTQTYELAE